MKVLLVIIIVIALLGVADSSYALKQHYAPADTSACDINETVNCSTVNQSVYSEFLGIPVAGLGLTGYVLIGTIAGLMVAERGSTKLLAMSLSLLTLVALAISLALTYIEVFILGAVCPLCVLSLALVTGITVLTLLTGARTLRARPA